MNQIIAVALGGAFGAVFRWFISAGVEQWLGRGFPYGTLAVNVIGSFLIGLLVDALLLQRVALSLEYRAAILIGLLGSLTTFSTFSLDTWYLIEQGQLSKAWLNIALSVVSCIFAVWLGLMLSKALFLYAGGSLTWLGGVYPYALLTINVLGALLLGLVATLLLNKTNLAGEYGLAIQFILIGIFITASSLYLALYFIEQGYTFTSHGNSIIVTLLSNSAFCGCALWAGMLIAKRI